MTTLRKPELNLDYLDCPVKSDKWKNLTFLKDGTPVLGKMIHPSETAAKLASDEFIASFEGDPECVSAKYNFKYKDYSHTIQIPWRDK